MAIEWNTVGQPKFDRIVEAIAHRVYGDGGTVRAIDGQGGDDGKDIEIRQRKRLTIAQLKYYPQGFSGGFGNRRPKIKESWQRIRGGYKKGRGRSAVIVRDWPSGKPAEWILVVPCKLKPAEYKFVEDLLAGTRVKLTIWDLPWLDNALATYPELHDYFIKDDNALLEERARLYNQETANLLDGVTDLSARVDGLRKVVDGQDPNWTWDFGHADGVDTFTLRAKHPHAAEASPITISMSGAFGQEHRDLAKDFQRLMGYGTTGAVTLPAEVVQHFSIDGPPIVAIGDTPGSVTIRSLTNGAVVGKQLTFDFEPLADGTAPSFTGSVTHVNQGHDGVVIEATFYGVLDIELLLDKGTKGGDFNIQLNPGGRAVSEVQRALALLETLAGGTSANVSTAGQHLMRLNATSVHNMDEDQQSFKDLIDDLAVISQRTGRDVTAPETFNTYDRAVARSIRHLLEGKCTNWPGLTSVSVTLNGDIDDGLRGLLSGEPVLIRVVLSAMTTDLLGTLIPFGDVTLWHPKVNVRDAREHLEALEEGRGADRVAVLDADFGLFRAFRESNFPSEMPLSLTPWDIPGVLEPPEFDPTATTNPDTSGTND